MSSILSHLDSKKLSKIHIRQLSEELEIDQEQLRTQLMEMKKDETIDYDPMSGWIQLDQQPTMMDYRKQRIQYSIVCFAISIIMGIITVPFPIIVVFFRIIASMFLVFSIYLILTAFYNNPYDEHNIVGTGAILNFFVK